MKSVLAAGAAALALAMSAAPVHAAVFASSNDGSSVQLTLDGATVLNSYDTGWIDSTGTHVTTNSNYIVSVASDGFVDSFGGPRTHNNWFAFDLSSLTGGFTTATLTIKSFGVTADAQYHMFDYGRDVDTLTGGSNGSEGYFRHLDLASGTKYGRFAYSVGDTGVTRTLTLNAAAVADINAAVGGKFALGGTLTPQAAGFVPEPATWAMMLLGFFGLGGALRTRKSAAAAA